MEDQSKEGVYETEVDYETTNYENEVATAPALPRRPPVGLPDSRDDYSILDPQDEKRTDWKKYRWIAVLVLASIAAVFTVANFGVVMTTDSQTSTDATAVTVTANLKSCLALKSQGYHTTGLYAIKPIENEDAFQTFCDMETDGGGWTLVTSIHESDIKRKCYSDDLWSSYVREDQASIIGV